MLDWSVMLPHMKIIVTKIVHVLAEKMEVPQGTSDVDSNQDGNAEQFHSFSCFGTQDLPFSVGAALTIGIVVVSFPKLIKSIPILIGFTHAG